MLVTLKTEVDVDGELVLVRLKTEVDGAGEIGISVVVVFLLLVLEVVDVPMSVDVD